ncbi:MAG: exodeoxyribonuclease III, partial [Firmicutes bacterium]|nr:exodeoxyribonuclease III [Bacillota bacterium]
ARLDYRMEWEDALRGYISELDKKKPVIYCGDLNVAHEEIDLKNPKTNRKSAGFSDEERAKFTQLLAAGFADSYRRLYPDKVEYSWWSYMRKARENNAGWRIDYFVVSDRIMEKIKDSFIMTQIMGSDHCPVGIEIEL